MTRSTDKDFTHGKHIDIMVGDCVESMKSLPDKSVQTCITSPPYWGLRDYGHEKQLGMEKTPEEFVANMVEVFREVRRVLRDDGTLWLNLGDSYASGKARYSTKEQSFLGGKRNDAKLGALQDGKRACVKHHDYLKDKDLVGIPWLVAFALQRDGWWLRQDIIWHKPNPMPESVKDRCTKSHEYIFLLTKSPTYYYDDEAVKIPVNDPSRKNYQNGARTHGLNLDRNDNDMSERMKGVIFDKKKKRSVWSVKVKPFKEAHFATYPPELIEPCILASTSEHGCCAECGAPYVREIKTTYPKMRGIEARDVPGQNKHGSFGATRFDDPIVTETTGWKPSCDCNAEISRCTVLDPFGGSGTTGAVALKHGRKAILCELNEDYAKIIPKRIESITGLSATQKTFDDWW